MSAHKAAQAVLILGSANADLLVRADHAPGPGETVLGGDYTLSPGGKGANQAVAAARAEAQVAFCGALGRDPFAQVSREALSAAGVDLSLLRQLDGPSGVALITVSKGGENSITVAAGANARLGVEHLPADFGLYSHLLMQQEIGPEVVLAAAQRARAAGVTVLLNAAPARPLSDELLKCLDYLIVNEGELAALQAGKPEVAASELLTRGPKVVIVTLGAAGSLAVSGTGVIRQPAFPVQVVDTTGAGDTFCGALTAWLAAGENLPGALRAANMAGALACTGLGAQAAMPSRDQITAALDSADSGQ